MRTETWRNRTPLRISGRVIEGVEAVVARLEAGSQTGEGEAVGVSYHAETADALRARIETVRARVEAGMDRHELQQALPPGGARNALDCALWALASREARQPTWRMANLESVRPLVTTFTIGADAPSVCAERAKHWLSRGARALKLKLSGDADDLDRVKAVRREAPSVWLGVDANQGFSFERLVALAPRLAEFGVALIEQPLPIGGDAALADWRSPIPLAADESFQVSADLARLEGRYQVANIKLDKTGGLTEALACVAEASRLGLRVMVGNMAGTSLAMAPAFIVGQFCEIVDLDGPIYFERDRDPATRYEDGLLLRPGGWDWHD